MLKELIVITAFLLSLSGILVGFSIIQKNAEKQVVYAEKEMEKINADN